jgi:hypothetical protein
MKLKTRMCFGYAAFAAALLTVPFSGAQQKQSPMPQATAFYDVSRETIVQGTVVSYTATSTLPPIGPHATIQTSSGIVDVHLGSAPLMKQNDIFLAAGDSVKIVGASVTFGTAPVFLARILQKGSQTVTLRNSKGIPILAKPATAAKVRSISGGAR